MEGIFMKGIIRRFIRQSLKRPVYTGLNLVGLATGLACFGLISIWIQHEKNFDRMHKQADRIFRVSGQVETDTETFKQAVTCSPMASTLVQDFPEVKAAVRLDQNDAIVRYSDNQFKEDGLLFTDPSFFDIFDFNLILGDEATALSDPYSIILTTSIAKKYFGNENPLGKSITIFLYDPKGQGAPYKVTGVVADPPANSHFNFKFPWFIHHSRASFSIFA